VGNLGNELRKLSRFDAVLVAYTFATLFAVFGITYRYAMVDRIASQLSDVRAGVCSSPPAPLSDDDSPYTGRITRSHRQL
jgi:hypothetical protein